MKELLKKIIERFRISDPVKNAQFIEHFYSKKYGGPEKAALVFKELKQNSKSEEEFQQSLQEKLKNDLHYSELKNMGINIQKSKTITQLIYNLFNFKNSIQSKDHDLNKVVEDYDVLLKPAFEETYLNSDTKNDIIKIIKENVTFTLAQTRRELGFAHPRTFNPWIKAFFGNKYEDKLTEKGRSAGILTFDEYLEIVSSFMISYNEKKLDFSNIEELNRRFTEDKKISKRKFKELTNNNYSKLKDLLSDHKVFNEKTNNSPIDFRDPDTYRTMPFSIVSILKNHYKGYAD